MPHETIELTRSTLLLTVHGRTLTVRGEAYLPGHGSPDFVVYRSTLVLWDDGQPVTGAERSEVLACIGRAARRQGLVVEIE